MSFIYLASPYAHPDPKVIEERYRQAMKAVHQMLLIPIWVYSPIVHCHELAKIYDLPKSHEFWEAYDFAMLAASSSLMILRLPDWEISKGVLNERAEAERLGVPREYMDP